MRIVDKYILKKFLGAFVLSIVLILAVAVVFDVSEKLEDFRKGATLNEVVFDYYLNFVTFYGNMFSSMFVFISTIWFTSKMASNSELVAILTSGVSFKRMLLPYLIGSLIVASVSLALNHFFLPQTNIKRIKFEQTYVGGSHKETYTQNIHRQIKPGHYVYFETFSADRQSGYRFTYEVITDGILRSKLSSDFIRFDTIINKWQLDNWTLRTIDTSGAEHLEIGRKIDTAMAFTSAEVVPRLFTVSMMNTPELLEFIEKEKIRGSENMNSYFLELHRRTAFPVSTFVLVLIAVALSSRKSRGGLGINIAIGLLICLAYVFMMQISTTFAATGNFSPLLAVWLPNIIFAAIGLYLYYIAPK